MLLRSIQIIIIACFVAFSQAQNKSAIDFTIKNLGFNVDGHFSSFTIKTTFTSNGELKNISGKIDVKSINTGIDSRDEHLLKVDYFDVENYKNITLQSTEIINLKENTYKIKANLKIKGVTKAIQIPVEVVKTNTYYQLISNFDINRKDFNIGGSSFVMAKTVKISVKHYQNL